MAGVYKTSSGDTWDMIAKKVYGDEMQVSFLMSNNQKLLKYFIFPEDVEVSIEDLPETASNMPLWRE